MLNAPWRSDLLRHRLAELLGHVIPDRGGGLGLDPEYGVGPVPLMAPTPSPSPPARPDALSPPYGEGDRK